MKMTPEFQKAQDNMQPGVITADGFLGDDERPIVEIIAHDEETMRRLDLDFDEVIEKLEYLKNEGRKGLGEPVTVDNTWHVRVDDARGYLPSPFEDGIFRKVNVQVQKIDSKEEIFFTELAMHLISKYHFLEGKGSPFRLEPEQIRKVLF